MLLDNTPPAEVEYQQRHYNDSQQAAVAVHLAIWEVATALFVILRLLGRKWKKAPLAMDDYTIIIGLFPLFAADIAFYLQIFHGRVGRHLISVTLQDYTYGQKCSFIFSVCNAIAWPLPKISLCFLYLRIFTPWRAFRWITWSFIGILSTYLVIKTFLFAFPCHPIQSAWGAVDGTCMDFQKLYSASGALNITLDFITFFLPMPLLWRLRMSKRRRLAVCGLFGLGLITCLLCVIRIVVMDYLANPYDLWWDQRSNMLVNAEMHLGFIVACLPMTVPVFERLLGLYHRYLDSLRSSLGKTSSANAGDGKANSFNDLKIYQYSNDRLPRSTYVYPKTSPHILDTEGQERPVSLGYDIEKGFTHKSGGGNTV